MIKETIRKFVNDTDVNMDNFLFGDIKFVLNYIVNNYIQFILLLFVFFIIYIVDYINNVNNMIGLQFSPPFVKSQNNIITKNINLKNKVKSK
jgi:hypothetical protein